MRKNLPLLTLATGLAAFLAGVIWLFLLRFEVGDVYPPYSSLRADPLGTMALCESLEKIPALKVRRDLTTANRLPVDRNTAYLHLAAEVRDWQWLTTDTFNEVRGFLDRGGRLVITLHPRSTWSTAPFIPPTITTTNTTGTNVARARPAPDEDEDNTPRTISVAERWGVEFDRLPLARGANDNYLPVTVTNQTMLPLPATLTWHSGIVLTNLAPEWEILYTRGNHAVMAERQFGRGSVVLATDSFFLSNQALWKEREASLLAWLIGPVEHVYFDEAHLGVTESSGIALLMHKYRLTGVLAAVVVLAGLFIWKNSFSLVPPHPQRARPTFVAGKDSTAGFVNLLRRNIPPRQLIEVCFEQWTRSLFNRANYRITAVDQAQTIMERERARPSRAHNPAQVYREIAAALKQKSAKPPAAHQPPSAPPS